MVRWSGTYMSNEYGMINVQAEARKVDRMKLKKAFAFDTGGWLESTDVQTTAKQLRGQVLAASNRCRKCGSGRRAWEHGNGRRGSVIHPFVSIMTKTEAKALYAKVEQVAKRAVAKRLAERKSAWRNERRREKAEREREERREKQIAEAVARGTRRKIGTLVVQREPSGDPSLIAAKRYVIMDANGFEQLTLTPKVAVELADFLVR